MNELTIPNRFRKTWTRASALAVLVLLIATGLGVSGWSIQGAEPHNTSAELQSFVGTWQAKFRGKTFQTIKLVKKDDKLSGTVSHANVSVDPKSGELNEVEVLDGNDPIVEAQLKNGTLLITEADAIQFEMKITGADEAQLQIVIPPDAADEVPAAKPWRLVRVKSKD